MRIRSWMVAYFVVLSVTGVQAQSMEDRLRAQLSSVTAQLRDLQSNQTTLQAEKTAAEQERDALKGRLVAAEATAHAAQRHPSVAPAAADVSKEKEQMGALAQEVTRLTQVNATLVSDKERLAKEAVDKDAVLTVCQTKNAQAVKIARELLVAYHDVDVGDIMGKSEPITGLDRVEFEQLEQDYGDKIYDSQLSATVKPAATANSSAQPKN